MTASASYPCGRVAIAVLAVLLAGCPEGDGKTASADPSAPGPAATLAAAPSWDELRGATIRGVEESEEPVKLTDGRWEGRPFAEGAASRPTVELLEGFRLTGDLDGDGASEAIVLLAGTSGGTGTNSYLAVVGRKKSGLDNLGTRLLGDRVQVRGGAVQARRVQMDLVQAGSSDPACCPGELVRRWFEMSADGLVEPLSGTTTGRLSFAAVEGREWVLRAWTVGEPVPDDPVVTLTLKEGRLGGSAGCNNYFATATEGDAPGAVVLGPVGSTKKMCPPPIMSVEDRYLQQLGGVMRFGFLVGRLALTYQTDQGAGAMLFDEKK